MKKFILRTFLLILPLLLLLTAAEVYLRSLPNPSRAKNAWLTAHADSVEVLILGSSHSYYGLAPEVFGPKAYNAAQVSQTLRYDNFILNHYAFRSLRTVILPISDFSFHEDFEHDDTWYYASRYRLYMGCDYHSWLSRYGFEFCSMPTFRERLKTLWQPARLTWSKLGQGTDYTLAQKPKDWNNAEARARNNTYRDAKNVALNEAFFHQLIQTVTQRYHAHLVLISTPLTAHYRACQYAPQVRAMEARIRHAVQSNPRVSYFDFRVDTDFTANDFYDADHLTLEGAEKLSKKLRTRLAQESVVAGGTPLPTRHKEQQ